MLDAENQILFFTTRVNQIKPLNKKRDNYMNGNLRLWAGLKSVRNLKINTLHNVLPYLLVALVEISMINIILYVEKSFLAINQYFSYFLHLIIVTRV